MVDSYGLDHIAAKLVPQVRTAGKHVFPTEDDKAHAAKRPPGAAPVTFCFEPVKTERVRCTGGGMMTSQTSFVKSDFGSANGLRIQPVDATH
jgi:hypothetical protein